MLKVTTPPSDVEGLDCQAFGPRAPEQKARIFVLADVLEELIFAASRADESFDALLLGTFAYDGSAGYMVVSGFETIEGSDRYKGYRSEIGRHISGRESGHVLGMFCQHGEARLSSESAMLHFSLFNIPYQCLFVCDVEGGLIQLFTRDSAGDFVSSQFEIVKRASL